MGERTVPCTSFSVMVRKVTCTVVSVMPYMFTRAGFPPWAVNQSP